jgi:hypothetical protein
LAILFKIYNDENHHLELIMSRENLAFSHQGFLTIAYPLLSFAEIIL